VAGPEVVQLDFHITPLRVERFVDAYRPAVQLALEYGARGYSFYRFDEDPSHFAHVSYWDDRKKFDRYWMSREMRDIRTKIVGMHDHLLLPHYGAVLDRA
jgi:quinol monooxygenase YgiN